MMSISVRITTAADGGVAAVNQFQSSALEGASTALLQNIIINMEAAEVAKDPFHALSEEQRRPHGYPILVSCCIRDWASKIIDYQINGDPRLVNYRTTYADNFQHPTSFYDTSSTITPAKDSKKLPGSSPKSELIKYTAPLDGTKIQQNRLNRPLRSAYSDTYQFRRCAPPKPVMQSPTFTMGDPERIREHETTYSAHFKHKGRVSSEVINQTHGHQLINLGDYPENWKTTTTDVHPAIKTEPVLLVKRDRNYSCIPRGDMDPERNRARMTATSYKFFFSKNNPRGPLVRIDGPATRTKSNVVLGQVGKEGLTYTSSSSADYPPRTADRVMPITPVPGYEVPIQETGPKLTTMQADYRPVKGTSHSLRPEQLELLKRSHIPAHFKRGYFTTAYKEVYTPKHPIQNVLACVPVQTVSHMPF